MPSSFSLSATAFAGIIATASNNTEGPPPIFSSTVTFVPSLNVAPPILEAITTVIAPSAAATFCKFLKVFASVPSLIKMPNLRPLKELGPFLIMLNLSEGFKSVRGATAGFAAAGNVSNPKPSATRCANLASTFNK